MLRAVILLLLGQLLGVDVAAQVDVVTGVDLGLPLPGFVGWRKGWGISVGALFGERPKDARRLGRGRATSEGGES